MSKQKPRKNEIMQIAQQVADTNASLRQQEQQADAARRSPPPIMGSTDSAMRSLFCAPQMR